MADNSMPYGGSVLSSGTYYSIKASVVVGEALHSSLVTLAILVACRHECL